MSLAKARLQNQNLRSHFEHSKVPSTKPIFYSKVLVPPWSKALVWEASSCMICKFTLALVDMQTTNSR